MLPGMEDPDRKTAYAAEDMVGQWLDAVCPETGQVRVTLEQAGGGRVVAYAPEVEPRFTRPSEVVGFVDKVMDRLRQQARQSGTIFRGREQRPVRVAPSSGWKKATYRDGVIFLPERERGGAWALRGLVVLHELAHHLNTGVDGAIIDVHGDGFRTTFMRLLECIGWVEIAAMLRDAYRQVGLDRRHRAEDGMLARVGKLLRHAEGAATPAERDTFFAKAQELATFHSIELAVARAAQDVRPEDQRPTFELVRLGHRGQHSNVRFVALMVAIARANDLRCSIRGDNTGVTLYGFRGDIDVVKTLYASLVLQMVRDADAYIRSGAHRPVHGRTARAAFYAGWANRIGQRLTQAQWMAQVTSGAASETVDQATGELQGSKGLALVAKDVEVANYYDYMKRQHGVRGTWRGGGQIHDGHSVARGRAAAERARLGQPRELDGLRP